MDEWIKEWMTFVCVMAVDMMLLHWKWQLGVASQVESAKWVSAKRKRAPSVSTVRRRWCPALCDTWWGKAAVWVAAKELEPIRPMLDLPAKAPGLCRVREPHLSSWTMSTAHVIKTGRPSSVRPFKSSSIRIRKKKNQRYQQLQQLKSRRDAPYQLKCLKRKDAFRFLLNWIVLYILPLHIGRDRWMYALRIFGSLHCMVFLQQWSIRWRECSNAAVSV